MASPAPVGLMALRERLLVRRLQQRDERAFQEVVRLYQHKVFNLVFRMIGRDPLHRARRPGLETYWAPEPAPANMRRYFQQF